MAQKHPKEEQELLTSLSEVNKTVVTAVTYFVSGNISGIAGVLFSHPFDTTRIRMQVDGARYRNAWQCFFSTARTEGPRALFRGVLSPMIGIGFQNAILFGTYGPTLEVIHRVHGDAQSEQEALSHVFIAGCVGGTAQTLVCTPLELVKIRMQMNRDKPLKLLKTARRVWMREGVARGLYKGLGVTVLRDCPSYGAWFLSYEWLKRYLIDTRGWDGAWSPFALFLAGGVAGVNAWACIYPIDVVKSRMQSVSTPLSLAECTRASYREGGWRIFFRGFGATMVKGFVCSGVTFLAVEAVLLVSEWTEAHRRQ